MNILIVSEGTSLRPVSMDGAERQQSSTATPGAVQKIAAWKKSGAGISYLTSCIEANDVAMIRDALQREGFADGALHYPHHGESLSDLVQRLDPDVLIEDDCRSIGMENIIGIQLNPQQGILSIVVPEFEGLAHLPDDPQALVAKI